MNTFIAAFLPLLIAYAMALAWCAERWNAPTDYFAHCWLVPIIGAAVIWLRRRDWRERPREVDLRGLWLLIPGLVLHALGAALMVDSWSATSLVFTVPGAAWLALGLPRLRGLWPVLWLVVFMIPMPIYVEGRTAFMLKEIAVQWGAWLANLMGADIVREGDRLVPLGIDGSLFVADACGGLRSMLAMMTLGYCMAFFSGPPSLLRRVLLLALVPPMAIAANVLRISALCLMARWFGTPFAEGGGHFMANAVEWLSLLLALLAIDAALVRRVGVPSGVGIVPTQARLLSSSRPSSLRIPALCLWLLAAPLLWLSSVRPFADRDGRSEQLAARIGNYELEPRSETRQLAFERSLPRWRDLLGTTDFVWRRYRNPDKYLINLVALFHDTNWKSVHPPRICIEGSNMVILQDDLVPASWLDAGADVKVSRIVAQRATDGWRYVTLSVFGTDSWASGDYWDFTMHHLPLALFRQSESGFLLRVESPIYHGEDVAVAEDRCAEFLEQLMPMARRLLR